MQKLTLLKKSFLFVLILGFIFIVHAPPAGAFFLTDWFKNVQNFFADADTPKIVTLDSNITLAPEGDVDKNGQIDAGDTVTFTYKITNPTKQTYPFVTITTAIPRNSLNFIHNVRGTASLSDANNTITIPNLIIPPQGEVIISFDARINYSSDEQSISTEPEILTRDAKSLIKVARKEIKAKPLKNKDMPGMIQVKSKP